MGFRVLMRWGLELTFWGTGREAGCPSHDFWFRVWEKQVVHCMIYVVGFRV